MGVLFSVAKHASIPCCQDQAETAFVTRNARGTSPVARYRRGRYGSGGRHSVSLDAAGNSVHVAEVEEQTTELKKVTSRLQDRARMWSRRLRKLRGRKAATAIDERCRSLFPAAFLVFNIVYWGIFQVNPWWPDIPLDPND